MMLLHNIVPFQCIITVVTMYLLTCSFIPPTKQSTVWIILSIYPFNCFSTFGNHIRADPQSTSETLTLVDGKGRYQRLVNNHCTSIWFIRFYTDVVKEWTRIDVLANPWTYPCIYMYYQPWILRDQYLIKFHG